MNHASPVKPTTVHCVSMKSALAEVLINKLAANRMAVLVICMCFQYLKEFGVFVALFSISIHPLRMLYEPPLIVATSSQ